MGVQALGLPAVEIRPALSGNTSLLNQVDIHSRPIRNAQEVLRFVPGLFIAQHAGGGKAEQIFLRGFDIGHGADIALSVDGLPVYGVLVDANVELGHYEEAVARAARTHARYPELTELQMQLAANR